MSTELEPISDEFFNAALVVAVVGLRLSLTEEKRRRLMPGLIVHRYGIDPADNVLPTSVTVAIADYEAARGRQILQGLGAQFGRARNIVTAIFILTEGWFSDRSAAERGGLRPREDPQRREILLVAGTSHDGRSNMARIDFTRDEANRIVPTESHMVPYTKDPKAKLENGPGRWFFEGYYAALEEALLTRESKWN